MKKNNQPLEKIQIIKDKLISLGFSETEASVYIYLLRNGASSIQAITSGVTLPRSSVNLSVENLLKNDLISFFERGKRKNYVPKDLNNLTNFLIPEEQIIQNKKKTVTSLIPDLESIFYLQSQKESNIEFLEGEEGLKKVYEMTLDCKDKEILRISIASEKFNFIPEFLKDYVERKNKRGIKTRMIIPNTEFSVTLKDGDKKDNRESRFLDKNIFNPDVTMAIWDNNVALTTWDRSLKTMVIKSENQANFFKSIFSIIWEVSNK